MIVLVLIMQCGLIGSSAWAIAGGLSPELMGVHITCIAANIMFVLVNVRNLLEEEG